MGATAFEDRITAAVDRGVLRPASAVAARHDPMTTRRFLEILGTPAAGCIELRVLRAVCDRRGNILRGDDCGPGFGGSTLAGWYDDVERLVAQSRRLRGVSGYVTINPVRADLLARSDNRLARARHTTRDADIACLQVAVSGHRPGPTPRHQQHRRRAGRGPGPPRRHPRRPPRAGRLGPLGPLRQRRLDLGPAARLSQRSPAPRPRGRGRRDDRPRLQRRRGPHRHGYRQPGPADRPAGHAQGQGLRPAGTPLAAGDARRHRPCRGSPPPRTLIGRPVKDSKEKARR